MPENELQITTRDIEFGICLKNNGGYQYYLIPTDARFKELLFQMITQTYVKWKSVSEIPSVYNPSEKYPSIVRLTFPTDNDLVQKIKIFYNLENIPTDATQLVNIDRLFAYFCIYRTEEGKKLIAVRRAYQFKVASQQKFLSFIDDTLHYYDKKLFKIDNDFDFIITENLILIFRITGFEKFADLDEVILEKAQENTIRLGVRMSFVNVDRLKIYTSKHPRAARLIASIIARSDLEQTDERHLRAQCTDKEVAVEDIDGKLAPLRANENKFLHLLDRRRYTLRLIKRKKEIYEAGSRDQVS